MSAPSELPLTLEVFKEAPIGHRWRVNKPSYPYASKVEGFWEFEKTGEDSFKASRTDGSPMHRTQYSARRVFRASNGFTHLPIYEKSFDDSNLWE